MDSVLQKARLERENISNKIKELNEKLNQIDSFIDMYIKLQSSADHKFSTSEKTRIAGAVRARNRAEPISVVAPSNALTQKEAITSACAELLSTGEHMHTRELLEKLQSSGVIVGGKDKILTVSLILSRDPRFVANRRTGWSLAGKESDSASTLSDSDDGLG